MSASISSKRRSARVANASTKKTKTSAAVDDNAVRTHATVTTSKKTKKKNAQTTHVATNNTRSTKKYATKVADITSQMPVTQARVQDAPPFNEMQQKRTQRRQELEDVRKKTSKPFPAQTDPTQSNSACSLYDSPTSGVFYAPSMQWDANSGQFMVSCNPIPAASKSEFASWQRKMSEETEKRIMSQRASNYTLWEMERTADALAQFLQTNRKELSEAWVTPMTNTEQMTIVLDSRMKHLRKIIENLQNDVEVCVGSRALPLTTGRDLDSIAFQGCLQFDRLMDDAAFVFFSTCASTYRYLHEVITWFRATKSTTVPPKPFPTLSLDDGEQTVFKSSRTLLSSLTDWIRTLRVWSWFAKDKRSQRHFSGITPLGYAMITEKRLRMSLQQLPALSDQIKHAYFPLHTSTNSLHTSATVAHFMRLQLATILRLALAKPHKTPKQRHEQQNDTGLERYFMLETVLSCTKIKLSSTSELQEQAFDELFVRPMLDTSTPFAAKKAATEWQEQLKSHMKGNMTHGISTVVQLSMLLWLHSFCHDSEMTIDWFSSGMSEARLEAGRERVHREYRAVLQDDPEHVTGQQQQRLQQFAIMASKMSTNLSQQFQARTPLFAERLADLLKLVHNCVFSITEQLVFSDSSSQTTLLSVQSLLPIAVALSKHASVLAFVTAFEETVCLDVGWARFLTLAMPQHSDTNAQLAQSDTIPQAMAGFSDATLTSPWLSNLDNNRVNSLRPMLSKTQQHLTTLKISNGRESDRWSWSQWKK